MSAPTLPPATPDSHAGPTCHRIHQQADDATGLVRTVVCYLRTANAGTPGQRLLGRQRTKLEREAAAHGWRVAAWVEDPHQSGTTLARPGLQRALALLADHQADALLATDITRLAVTPKVDGELAAVADRQGWRLLTIQTRTTPTPA